MSLRIENLNFSYGSIPVLKDISFSADDGTLTAVLGPNGVGKTTLFRCILGLLTKYEGSVLADGEDVKNMSARQLAHRISYIPQIHGMAFSFSVEDIVLMGTAHGLNTFSFPRKEEKEAAEKALNRLKIRHLAGRDFSKLSGGEQQLVLIARALAQETKNILMDEPTASLDYGNQMVVLEQVRMLADEGYTILLSTHHPQQALWYADRALALSEGQICADGEPKEAVDDKLIRRLYGIDAAFVSTNHGKVIIPKRGGEHR